MAIFIKGAIYPSAEFALSFEETTSLVDVISQVKAQPDGRLDVYIDSPGGSVEEGFAIHDYLESLGREVRTIAINQCASIATVIFLAGTKRKARCELMIHNPWWAVEGDSSTMQQGADILDDCERRLEKFYSEKLDIDPQTISNLMASETYISSEQALALGFANEQENQSPALAIATLTKKPNTNQKQQKMKKPFSQRVKSALNALVGAILSMELTTADGATLTVEREDGDPQVGDVASPDGDHVMSDGTTIVVVDGVITEIIASDEATPEEELEQARARIAELEAAALSDDDTRALAAVKELGGVKGLAALCSSYKPEAREGSKAADAPRVAKYKQDLSKIKNKR